MNRTITRREVHHGLEPLGRRLFTVPAPIWLLIDREAGLIVRIEQNQLTIVCYSETSRQLFDIVLEEFKDVAGTLLWNLQDQTLRFFYVESSDEHSRVTRADLDDVIAFAHSFPFLI